MVDLDTTLEQQFLDVAVGQVVAQVQRTATMITSGGNRNPANADRGGRTGRRRFESFTVQACVAQRGWQNTKEKVRGVTERVMGAAHDGGSTVQDRTSNAVGTVKDKTSDAVDTVKDKAGDVATQIQQAPAAARRQTQGNPIAAGLIAFGAGLLAASLLPATELEKRAGRQVRDHADELKDFADQHDDKVDQAVDKAGDQVDKRTDSKLHRPGGQGRRLRPAAHRPRRHQQLSGQHHDAPADSAGASLLIRRFRSRCRWTARARKRLLP